MRLHPVTLSARRHLSRHCVTYGLLLSSAGLLPLPSSSAWAATATLSYSIGAGPLDKALSQFAASANVILSFAPGQTANRRTPGLQGNYSVEQGFAALLQGSGLQAASQAPGSYVLQAVPSSDAVNLAPTRIDSSTPSIQGQYAEPDTGYKAERSRAATKTSTALSETPRSVSVVTQQRMKDQKSQSLTEVLGYVPGIFAPPFAAGDSLAGDLFFIRGFNATDYGYGLLRDGLRVQGNRYDTTTEPYGLERVEIFRGPSSILYGEMPLAGWSTWSANARPPTLRVRCSSVTAATIAASLVSTSRVP